MAWDCITIWVIKLITTLTVPELLELASRADTNLLGIDLSWTEEDQIKALVELDDKATKAAKTIKVTRRRGKAKKPGRNRRNR